MFLTGTTIFIIILIIILWHIHIDNKNEKITQLEGKIKELEDTSSTLSKDYKSMENKNELQLIKIVTDCKINSKAEELLKILKDTFHYYDFFSSEDINEMKKIIYDAQEEFKLNSVAKKEFEDFAKTTLIPIIVENNIALSLEDLMYYRKDYISVKNKTDLYKLKKLEYYIKNEFCNENSIMLIDYASKQLNKIFVKGTEASYSTTTLSDLEINTLFLSINDLLTSPLSSYDIEYIISSIKYKYHFKTDLESIKNVLYELMHFRVNSDLHLHDKYFSIFNPKVKKFKNN